MGSCASLIPSHLTIKSHISIYIYIYPIYFYPTSISIYIYKYICIYIIYIYIYIYTYIYIIFNIYEHFNQHLNFLVQNPAFFPVGGPHPRPRPWSQHHRGACVPAPTKKVAISAGKDCWLVVEPDPSEKWWSSSVGIMTFLTEWKNKIHVPSHQPDWETRHYKRFAIQMIEATKNHERLWRNEDLSRRIWSSIGSSWVWIPIFLSNQNTRLFSCNSSFFIVLHGLNPLKNMTSSVGIDIPNWMESQSKFHGSNHHQPDHHHIPIVVGL